MNKIFKMIKFSGKNLNDVFGLDCVKVIIKTQEGEPILVMRPEKMIRQPDVRTRMFAEVGDVLVQNEQGLWAVVEKAKVSAVPQKIREIFGTK